MGSRVWLAMFSDSDPSDPWFVLAEVVVFLCLAGLTALLPALHRVPISDISASDHGLAITTARPHRIRSSKLCGPRLLVWGTHCPPIDCHKKALPVKVLNSIQLMVSKDSFDSYYSSSLASSMGFCRLIHPWSIMWTYVYGVPVAVAGIVQLLLLGILGSFGAFRLVLLAPAVILGLSRYVYQWRQTSNPLHAKLLKFRREMPLQLQRCERGGMRGISTGQLQDFYQFFETFISKRDMYYVVENIVKPLTKPFQRSFAELLGPGPMDYFVSHQWENPFVDLLNALLRHRIESTRYWICSFSNSQWHVAEELGNGEWQDSSFMRALSSPYCKGTCVVFGNPRMLVTTFQRIWTVFEFYLSCRNSGREVKEGIFFCTPHGLLQECSFDFVKECAERIRGIHIRNAKASTESDRLMVVDIIEHSDGGMEVIQQVLEEYVMRALARTCSSNNLPLPQNDDDRAESAVLAKCLELMEAFKTTLASSVRCPPGANRAIGAGKLQELQRAFESILDGKDMYWLCDYIVKPLTRYQRISFAELVGCGELNWFISHWWGMHFNQTVESVMKHAQGDMNGMGLGHWRNTKYWICTFSNNQWAMDQEIPPNAAPSESSFYKALRCYSCRGTCMVLDERVVPLTRAWCLFELLQTFVIQDEAKHSREGLSGLSILTSSGVLNSGKCSIDTAMAIGQKLTTLDLENASASKEEDQNLIFNAVEEAGGFDAINSKLRHNIQNVITAVASQFDHDLQQLHAQLNS